MNVDSVTRQSLGISQLIRAQVGSGRISLPVKSNQIYANFKHITGIGGSGNQPSFTLSQLRSLDNLIDRLKLLKGEKGLNLSLDDLSENDITKMIEDFNRELYTELHKKNPYKPLLSSSAISLDIFV
jgi:hypothetical protein